MITINCSRLAAEHLYKGFKKGSDEGFFEPATSQSLVEQVTGPCFQWVVHSVKLGYSTCLIAMEYETRYCHVIQQVKKGDMQGFFSRLQKRLMNSLEWQCQDYSLLDSAEMEQGIEHYFSVHKDTRFYQRTDKSVMTHINQVAAEYSDIYYSTGCFPPDEETALDFDIRLNQTWRIRKGEKYDLQVNEKMIQRWLTEYLHFAPLRVSDAMAQIKDVKQEQWNMRLTGMSATYSQLNEDGIIDIDSTQDNVIDLSRYQQSKK